MRTISRAILSIFFGCIPAAGCDKNNGGQDLSDVPRLEVSLSPILGALTELASPHIVQTYRDLYITFKVTGLEDAKISCEGCPAGLIGSTSSTALLWWPNEWDVGNHAMVFTATGKDGSKVSVPVSVDVKFEASIIGSFIGSVVNRDVYLLGNSELELSDAFCFKGSVRTPCPWIREEKIAFGIPLTFAVLHASDGDEADVVIVHAKKFPSLPRRPHLFHLYPMLSKTLDDGLDVEFPRDRKGKAGQMQRVLVRCRGASKIELKSARPNLDKLQAEQAGGIFIGEAVSFGTNVAEEYEFTPAQAGESKLTIECTKDDKVVSHDLLFSVAP